MPSPSPLCQVKEGAGAYQPTTNGVDVSDGSAITINLISSAGVSTWSIQCITTDELSVAATVNAGLTIDAVAKTCTFTAPTGDARTYRFQSIVNGGIGPDGTYQASYYATFCIYTLATGNRRVHATDETYESDATFGWVGDFNDLIRNPFAGSYMTTPTGTGFVHIAGGNMDAAAALIAVGADVTPSATQGEVVETNNAGAGIVTRWGKRWAAQITNATTGSQDNVTTLDANSNPAGGIIFTGAAPTVTGLTGGYSGRTIVLHATGGPLILANETTSTAANRIITGTGANATIADESSAILTWEATNSRWRLLNPPVTAGLTLGVVVGLNNNFHY